VRDVFAVRHRSRHRPAPTCGNHKPAYPPPRIRCDGWEAAAHGPRPTAHGPRPKAPGPRPPPDLRVTEAVLVLRADGRFRSAAESSDISRWLRDDRRRFGEEDSCPRPARRVVGLCPL
jgi:hypothetical protein